MAGDCHPTPRLNISAHLHNALKLDCIKVVYYSLYSLILEFSKSSCLKGAYTKNVQPK